MDIRCKTCHKLLAKSFCGKVEIKCPRCKKITMIAKSCEPEHQRVSSLRNNKNAKIDTNKKRLPEVSPND